MRPFCNIEVVASVYPEGSHLVVLFFQGNCIQHNTIANEIGGVFMKNSRGNLVQYHFLAIDIQRMTSIRASLEPGDDIILWCKIIYNLPFSFVAPLQA